MNLTLWKKEAKDQFRKEYKDAYHSILHDDLLDQGNEWFESFCDTLIDRIHAHTLEEVRGIVEEKKKEAVEMEDIVPRYSTKGAIVTCDDILSELELLEHPTDI